MRGKAILAHGGGPTAVLNASLAGVIDECRRREVALAGARFGAAGLLTEDLIDLTDTPGSQVECAPGSALGSSRHKLETPDFERILDICRRRDVRFLFYTGGNGSMATALELDRCARAAGSDLRVIGIPKTIDNDLDGTDHSPGYASCARFFACAVRDAGEDNRALATPVMFIETLGRNAGWVVAATGLARHGENDPPHLIYFPENRLSADRLCADVEDVYRRLGRVVVAVCEGQPDQDGGWFGADLGSLPGARDPLPANLGHVLSRMVWSRTGLRSRCEKPGLIARASSTCVSKIDRTESRRCGEAAVRAAVEGHTGKMVSIRRVRTEPYEAVMELVSLEEVAGRERLFPREWMDGTDVSQGFRDWARPITGDIDPLPRLELR